jgi:hypothetical protein
VLNWGGIPTSLGEIINIKFHLDMIKDRYSQINLSFNTSLWDQCLHTEAPDWEHKKTLWNKFLNDIGTLFFSQKPYVLQPYNGVYGGDMGVMSAKLRIPPTKAEMGHLLCKGNSLNIGEYIVITTKARQANRKVIYPLSIQLWPILRNFPSTYKFVILGERNVEMRKEYGGDTNSVFSMYETIVSNLPKDRIVDLTVPALGETVSDFSNIQQDCLIMKEARFVITFGVGGNFCLSTSVANMAIGFRTDNLEFTDSIFHNKEYPNAIITKDWGRFIQAINTSQ